MYHWFACFSWCILTKHRYYLPNTHTTTSKDIVFRADFSCIFFQFFLLIPPKCDTCDSKKTTLRLECAHLCASTRAREKRSPKILPPLFSSFSLLPPSSLPLFLSSSFLILPHFLLLLFWGIQYLQVLILLYAYYRFEDEQRKKCTFP